MPIDPTPEGGEVMHQPVVPAFPQKVSEEGGRDARDEEDSRTL